MGSVSDRWSKQPRYPTSESYARRPAHALEPVGGAYYIVSGEAALSISLAARNYSCFVTGLRASILYLLAAVFVCLVPCASGHSLSVHEAQQAPAATAGGTPTIERIE